MLFAPERGLDPDRNPLIRLFRRFVPVTTALHGQRFLVRQGGRLAATPLFVTLLLVEVTDIIFAAVTRFHMLKYRLALVLIFVGLKMAWLNDLWDGTFPIGASLAIIGALIGASLVLSLVVAPRPPAARPVDSR